VKESESREGKRKEWLRARRPEAPAHIGAAKPQQSDQRVPDAKQHDNHRGMTGLERGQLPE
jgi:hypothetical protein